MFAEGSSYLVHCIEASALLHETSDSYQTVFIVSRPISVFQRSIVQFSEERVFSERTLWF